MNPFARAILRGVKDRRLQRFAAHWEALEALVIRVYKGSLATPGDETEYRTERAWLLRHYPRWQGSLEPYWRRAPVAGKTNHPDPFGLILGAPQAAAFVENWTAMQHLPAAREALNNFLVDQIK